MDRQDQNQSMRRRNLPPLYPSATSRSSRHGFARPSLFNNKPAATGGFTPVPGYNYGWASSTSYQTPAPPASFSSTPPPPSFMPDGFSGTQVSPFTFGGSFSQTYLAGSSSSSSYYQALQSGGVGGSSYHELFLSQDTFSGLGLAALTQTPTESSLLNHQPSSSSSPLPPLPKSTSLFGSSEFELPPLPPSLSSMSMPVNLQYTEQPPLPPSLPSMPVNLDYTGLPPLPPTMPSFSMSVNLDFTEHISIGDSEDTGDSGGGGMGSQCQSMDVDGLSGLNPSGAHGIGASGAVSFPSTGSIIHPGSSQGGQGNLSNLAVGSFTFNSGAGSSGSSGNGGLLTGSSNSKRKGKRPLLAAGRPPRSRPAYVAGFADGRFTQDQITRAMADRNLAKHVLTNPKGVRKALYARASYRRFSDRNTSFRAHLEGKLALLQKETESLSQRLQSEKNKIAAFASENKDIKVRLDGLKEHAFLSDVLKDTLIAEIRRLKVLAGEMVDSSMSNTWNNGMNNLQMVQSDSLNNGMNNLQMVQLASLNNRMNLQMIQPDSLNQGMNRQIAQPDSLNHGMNLQMVQPDSLNNGMNLQMVQPATLDRDDQPIQPLEAQQTQWDNIENFSGF